MTSCNDGANSSNTGAVIMVEHLRDEVVARLGDEWGMSRSEILA